MMALVSSTISEQDNVWLGSSVVMEVDIKKEGFYLQSSQVKV